MRLLPLATISALSIALGNTAWADITADDVVDNFGALAQASGFDLSMPAIRDGNKVVISEAILRLEFPFEAGFVSVSMPEFVLIEDSGNVSMEYPEQFSMPIQGRFGELGDFGIVFNSLLIGNTFDATGEPGDITYVRTIESQAFSMSDLIVPEMPIFDAELQGTLSDVASTMRVIEGDLIVVETSYQIGSMDTSHRYGIGNEYTNHVIFDETNATLGNLVSQARYTIPASGIDYLNIAKALRNGLSLSGEYSVGESTNHNTNGPVGAPIFDAASVSTNSTAAFSFDVDGISMEATGGKGSMTLLLSELLPMPITIEGDRISMAIKFPVSARAEPQDFRVAMSLEGMTVNEEIWDMFDPSAALPRDAATIAYDFNGTMTSDIDLLNFEQMRAMENSTDIPFALNSLDLSSFTLSGAGASIIGAGSFIFDNNDMDSFDDFPRPEGMGSFVISGANGLIDTLIDMGLMQPEEAMGARMGMSMMGRASGEDEVTSDVEINAEGHIIVNGQRMR